MMYESECLICKQATLGVPGWDGAVGHRDPVLAPWEGEGETVEGRMHFACVQTWPHKDAFFNELAAAYTGAPGSTVELRDARTGQLVTVRRETAEEYLPVHTEPGCLILAEQTVKSWTVLDTDLGWIRLGPRDAARIAADDRDPVEGGWAPVEFDRDVPLEAADWSVGQLLDHLDLEPRYPGLRDTPGVAVDLDFVAPDMTLRAVQVAVRAPLLVPERVRGYFAGLLAAEGADAFKVVLPD